MTPYWRPAGDPGGSVTASVAGSGRELGWEVPPDTAPALRRPLRSYTTPIVSQLHAASAADANGNRYIRRADGGGR